MFLLNNIRHKILVVIKWLRVRLIITGAAEMNNWLLCLRHLSGHRHCFHSVRARVTNKLLARSIGYLLTDFWPNLHH